jgi:CRP-like cAMP-binding protein
MAVSSIPSINLFRGEEQFEVFEAGATIFGAGDLGDVMFAVRDGEIDLVVQDRVVETVSPGGIFGEMSLIESAQRSATAVARTRCELVAIDERRFEFLVRQHPFFATHVLPRACSAITSHGRAVALPSWLLRAKFVS